MAEVFKAYRKSFLAGEYAACQHGRALLFNCGPAFSLEPAKYWHLSQIGLRIIRTYGLTQYPQPMHFHDPLTNHGGVGASSAEINCLYHWLIETNILSEKKNLQDQILWYQRHTWNQTGLQPSGVDFISQDLQGLIWVDVKQNTCTQMTWPFDDIDCMVVKTKDKIATHEHLQTITPSMNFNDLDDHLDPLYHALQTGDRSGFFQALKMWDDALKDLHLFTPLSPDLEEKLLACEGLLYRRGSGALGADTWLIFYTPEYRLTLIQWLNALGYQNLYPLHLEKKHANTHHDA
jgi:hypothetical protein